MIARFIASSTCGSLNFSGTFTSERTGIALFYKELDISKNAIIEHITSGDKVNPIDLLNSMRSRYAQQAAEKMFSCSRTIAEITPTCRRRSRRNQTRARSFIMSSRWRWPLANQASGRLEAEKAAASMEKRGIHCNAGMPAQSRF